MGISNQKSNKMKRIISYLAMPIMGPLYNPVLTKSINNNRLLSLDNFVDFNPDAVNIRRIAENKFDAVDCDRYVGICPRNYRPLCDNNGRIHSNPCTFLTAYCTEDRSLRLQERGSCMLNDNPKIAEPKEAEIEEHNETEEKENCTVVCPRISQPVCGSDGVKYPNECLMKAKNCVEGTDIRIVPCEEKCQKPCPRIYAPVCGSDGITYSNMCTLDIAICEQSNNGLKLELVSETACLKWLTTGRLIIEPKCKKCNHRRYSPICGSDLKTYPNKCMLEMANCNDGTEIELIHKGECK